MYSRESRQHLKWTWLSLWFIWILHCKYHGNLNLTTRCYDHFPNGNALHNSLFSFHLCSQFSGMILTFLWNTKLTIQCFITLTLNCMRNYCYSECHGLYLVEFSIFCILLSQAKWGYLEAFVSLFMLSWF